MFAPVLTLRGSIAYSRPGPCKDTVERAYSAPLGIAIPGPAARGSIPRAPGFPSVLSPVSCRPVVFLSLPEITTTHTNQRNLPLIQAQSRSSRGFAMPALMLYSRAVLDREIYCLRMACLLLYHAFMLVIVDPILYTSKS